MHEMNDRGSQAAQETRALEEAATWYARLLPGAADLDDHDELARAFSAWVAAAPFHAHAWKVVTAMSKHMAVVPPGIATPTLDRPGAKRRTILRSLMAVLAGGGSLLVLHHTSTPHWQTEHALSTAGELRNAGYGAAKHPRHLLWGTSQAPPTPPPATPTPCVFRPQAHQDRTVQP